MVCTADRRFHQPTRRPGLRRLIFAHEHPKTEGPPREQDGLRNPILRRRDAVDSMSKWPG
jgi:hypothetical protein